MRKTISVNDPLRYEGITIYQTDWSFSALQVMKDDEGPFNLAMAPLKINGDKKLYGTFLPDGDTESPQVKGMYVFSSIIWNATFTVEITYRSSPSYRVTGLETRNFLSFLLPAACGSFITMYRLLNAVPSNWMLFQKSSVCCIITET